MDPARREHCLRGTARCILGRSHRRKPHAHLSRCVHHPAISHESFAGLTVPTFRASTVVFPDAYANRTRRGLDGYSYGLYGTPTTRTLEAQLSALHGAERTVLLPSGQAAVTVVLLTVLMPGDHVLIPDTAYAGGALVGCDNTWATPLLFKPLDHGADLAMETLTKYVGGHSDLLLGSVSVRDLRLRQRLKDTMRMLGIGVSPDEAALALRGIETRGVRLAHVGRVALDVARRIVALPGAFRVLHPALPGCPGHEHFLHDFKGASGLFSVVLPASAAPRFGAVRHAAVRRRRVLGRHAQPGRAHARQSRPYPPCRGRRTAPSCASAWGWRTRTSCGMTSLPCSPP